MVAGMSYGYGDAFVAFVSCEDQGHCGGCRSLLTLTVDV